MSLHRAWTYSQFGAGLAMLVKGLTWLRTNSVFGVMAVLGAMSLTVDATGRLAQAQEHARQTLDEGRK